MDNVARMQRDPAYAREMQEKLKKMSPAGGEKLWPVVLDREACAPKASGNFAEFPATPPSRLRSWCATADSPLRVLRLRGKNHAGASAVVSRFVVALGVCLGAFRSAAAQDAAAVEAPTPVEQALIEHRCSATRATSAADTDGYHTCVTTELLGIRSDFGRDLTKLSPAERRGLDAVCNKVRNVEGRDAYVSCLSRQLAALHARRNPTPASPASPAATPQQSESQALAQAAAATPARSKSGTMLWTSVAIVSVFAMGGAAFVLMRRRAPSSKCRTCGALVPGGGDFCQACRHEAAEALRRAALERAEQERVDEEKLQRQQEQEEAWRTEQARQADLARRQQMERARREDEARLQEQQQRRDEEARERSEDGLDGQFDPYAVLGLAPDASRDSIDSAYEEARIKYDSGQVSHLSAEVQEHYKLKAQAVERAYQMLTASV
jgi:hypothetical protein